MRWRLSLRRSRDRLTAYSVRCRAGQAAPGGRSEENRAAGFLPAFLDRDTGCTYLARFADGRPAPYHVLDGMPDHLVVDRAKNGKVMAVKGCVLAGFLRDGRFYDRDQAAAAVSGQ